MDLKISLDDEVYNHFLNNNYSRADIIAVHTALNNAEPDRLKWIPISEGLPEEGQRKRYMELAKSYSQGLREGLAERENKK